MFRKRPITKRMCSANSAANKSALFPVGTASGLHSNLLNTTSFNNYTPAQHKHISKSWFNMVCVISVSINTTYCAAVQVCN